MLIGAMVCLLATKRGCNCSLTQAMVGCIVRCGIINLCASGKVLITSPTQLRSAIASTGALIHLHRYSIVLL